jgi:tRNA (mo5U34)-methyltransferase
VLVEAERHGEEPQALQCGDFAHELRQARVFEHGADDGALVGEAEDEHGEDEQTDEGARLLHDLRELLLHDDADEANRPAASPAARGAALGFVVAFDGAWVQLSSADRRRYVPAMRSTRTGEEAESLRRKVAAIESWYHRIDLGGGLETPGHFRMAEYLPHYHFPERMDGLRVLDVGASTGFFAYEFERRGAAEVVAVELPSWGDHDWTPRYRREFGAKSAGEKEQIDREVMLDGFSVVGEALGSTRVRRVFRAIYDLSSEDLGTFDIVFSGAMLMHVRDPVLGIQKMRECCKDDGRLIVSISTTMMDAAEPIARFVGEWNQCNWWQMSPKALEAVLTCCDFGTIEHRDSYTLQDVTGRFSDPTYVCHALPRR